MRAPLRDSPISAFACCSRPALTVCGIRPRLAGWKKAPAPPITAAPTAMCQTWAAPLIRSSARITSATPRTHVAGDHHQLPRQSIGPHAAGQHQGDVRDGERRKHDPQVRRRATDLQHREGDRHEDQRVAGRRGGLADPQQPELRLGQRAQAPAGRRRLSAHACRASQSARLMP